MKPMTEADMQAEKELAEIRSDLSNKRISVHEAVDRAFRCGGEYVLATIEANRKRQTRQAAG